MLNRPGFHTSEFIVSLLVFVGSIVADAQGYIGDGTAAKYSVAGFVAYVLSRGLAKTEPRP